ncbi:amidohydrolase family protein [Roseivirga sp. E12]|uniref:amidohydrolase family protein n=1 Tax=Roseivirga sp. E12 TaxID=2819237 RepID=UPI001ABC2B4A|nr:amidohydrolase family protein [Roseivirga sp. E12]MBO3700723.1 amidohydrolase family protein [Roseivirga sp. E12]
MKNLYFLTLVCLSISCTKAQEADFAFTHVNLITMESETVLPNQTVLIKEGKIITIGSSDDISTDQTDTVVDGTGKYLMPGLAEMHAHIPGNRDMDLLQETLFLYLSNGITTIRGMLGQPYHIELRDKVLSGEILGPRIYTSGPSINGNSVRSVEEAQTKVRAQKEAGYDFLKMHPGLTRENFDAVVATANEVGIPFAGHVSTGVGVRRALEAKYASIDHVDGYIEGMVPSSIRVNPNANGFFGVNFTDIVDTDISSQLVKLTLENDVWIVPTQAMMERWIGPEDPEIIAKNEEMKYMNPRTLDNWVRTKKGIIGAPNYKGDQALKFNQIRRDIIKEMHESGVKILLGSDAPQVFNVPGFSIHRELDAMVRSGLTPYEALYAGTVNPAQFFNDQGKYGTIVTGADADLILVNQNPFDNIANLRQQSGVMVRGQWLSAEQITQRLAKIAEQYKN